MKPILLSLLALPLAAFAGPTDPTTSTSKMAQDTTPVISTTSSSWFGGSLSTGFVGGSNPAAVHLHPNTSDIGSGYRPQQ